MTELKTLKDKINVEEDNRNMITLRTLKDLDFDCEETFTDENANGDMWRQTYINKDKIREELKAEAVKWVKEWKNNIGGTIDEGLGDTEYSFETAILLFKYFFNLTEEDLK